MILKDKSIMLWHPPRGHLVTCITTFEKILQDNDCSASCKVTHTMYYGLWTKKGIYSSFWAWYIGCSKYLPRWSIGTPRLGWWKARSCNPAKKDGKYIAYYIVGYLHRIHSSGCYLLLPISISVFSYWTSLVEEEVNKNSQRLIGGGLWYIVAAYLFHYV